MPDKIGSEKAEGAALVSPRRSPLLQENGQAFGDNVHMRLPWKNPSRLVPRLPPLLGKGNTEEVKVA